MAVASLVTFFDFLSEEVMLLVTLELVAPWCPAWKADTETPRLMLLVMSCRGPALFLELWDWDSKSSLFRRLPLFEAELVREPFKFPLPLQSSLTAG